MSTLDLKGLSSKSLRSSDQGDGPDLDLGVRVDVEGAVRRLPPLPGLLTELMRELRDVEADIGLLERRISSDASLTTRVLKMANSPFYARHAEILSVSRAVMTLGFRTVSNLVVAAGFRGAMAARGSIPTFQPNGVFRHALVTALLCARMSRLPATRPWQDQLFVAGLLHDIGRIALADDYSRHSSELIAAGGVHLEAERAVLGVDHQVVGAAVIEHWNLPAELRDPVTRHHAPLEELRDSPLSLATCVADLYVNERGIGRSTPIHERERMESALHLLGLERAALEELARGVEDEAQSVLGAL